MREYDFSGLLVERFAGYRRQFIKVNFFGYSSVSPILFSTVPRDSNLVFNYRKFLANQ
ncbi:hypothetical protein SBDP1_290065 [Syntrophobacter sp. SbD1]|nr:hypothetical protein SBDP1_290065 [Syntrophobacter sp. SbD1]